MKEIVLCMVAFISLSELRCVAAQNARPGYNSVSGLVQGLTNIPPPVRKPTPAPPRNPHPVGVPDVFARQPPVFEPP